MNLVRVDSSMIYAVGYDPEIKELAVVFNSGRAYWYEDVPAELHKALMASESKGQIMRDCIFDMFPHHNIYPYRRTN